MAITRIELPATWMAGLQTNGIDPFTSSWSTMVVYDPAQGQGSIMAYSTSSVYFGTALGFDHVLLTRALRDDASATIKLEMTDVEGYALLGAHNLESAPDSYSSLPSNWWNTVGEATPETRWGRGRVASDISQFRPALSQNYTGVMFWWGEIYPPVGQFEPPNPVLILEGNWTPSTPSLETPTGGVLRDRTKPIEFKWVHSGIYPQNKYELRYRVKGTSTWTTITVTSTSQTHTLPANTLTANEYEWQVRTTMSDGTNEATSPWSSIGIFNATNETNAPTIQSPTNGQTLPTQNLTVQWASVPNQTQINVELIRNGQRVQQVTRSQTGNSITLNGWLDNNQSYIVRLRVLASGQLWSDWAEVNINVSYTQPARAILNIIPDQDNANLLIRINNPPPTGTQPTPVRQDLFKREPGGSWIKLANLLPNSDYIDYAVASGQQYEYRVTVYADNDTSITSNVFRNSVKFSEDILSLANEPTVFVKLKLNPSRAFNKNYNVVKKNFAGRKFPVAEFSELTELNTTLSYLVSESDMVLLERIAASQETVLYRDPRGRKHYVVINAMTVNDEIKYPNYYVINLSTSEVDYKEGID